jgi:hypothetical protein
MKNLLPDIYIFNPTCEYAIANGNASWHPNKILQKMESDLSAIQMFLAKPKDVVLVDRIPSDSFISSLKDLGFSPPQFVLKNEAKSSKNFLALKKGQLLPWGWSPAAHKTLSNFKQNCSVEFKSSPVFNWQPEYKSLYSKRSASEILKDIIENYPNEHYISSEQLTTVCATQAEIEIQLQKWGKLMIKAPWSSSGRGLQPITKTPVHEKVWEKILAMIKDQGFVIVEPYLNKVLDLAFQFELKKGKVSFLGFSNFSTDYKGQYNGNSLNGLPWKLDQGVLDFAHSIPAKIIPTLIKIIESNKLSEFYEGYFGVDTLIFRNENNRLSINPCLEINVRQNMGLLALQFEKIVDENMQGVYRTFFQPNKTFFQFKKEMEEKNPLVLTNGKIKSGFVSLTEAQKDTLFGAYLLV